MVGNWLANHPEVDLTYVNFSTFDARPVYPDKFFAAPDGFFDGVRLEQGFYVDDTDLYIKSIRYPCMWVTGMTIRKSFYEAIGGFNPAFRGVITEDWEFNLRALSKGRAALCRRVLARVRYHSGNQSGDVVRTHLGAAKILQHALNTHDGASRFKEEIETIIRLNSNNAFHEAFARGHFHLSKIALKQPYLVIDSSRFMWKKKIVSMPRFLRYLLWLLSQKLSKIHTQSHLFRRY